MTGIVARNKDNIYLISIFIAIYALTWIAQSNLYFNWDVSWLMEASRRLLAGGSYKSDFFENNPPLILYLYVPPVLLTKFFHLNLMISLRVYIYILASISLVICNVLVLRIFQRQNAVLHHFFMVCVAFVFMILPLYEFGQREHLLLIFTLPYLLMMAIRVQGDTFPSGNAFLLGVYAGLGFFIKPFFLITWFLIEVYYHVNQRSIKAWLRPETLGLSSLLVIYLTTLFVRHPDYLYIVMPYAARWCFLTSAYPWALMLFNQYMLFCLIPIIFFLLQYHANSQKAFSGILVIALVGDIIAFLVQRTPWYYRLFPAYAMAILLLGLLFSLRLTTPYTKRDYILMGMLGSLTFFFLVHYSASIWTTLIFNSLAYYVFFACLFIGTTYLICVTRQNYKKLFIIISLIFILIINYLISDFIQNTFLMEHRFLLTTVLMVLSFYFLIIRTLERQLEHLLTLVVAMLVLSYPSYALTNFYAKFVLVKQRMEKLITFLKVNASHQSVYFFTTDIKYVFPVIQYAGDTTSSSRFSHFLGLGGIIKQPYMSVKQISEQRARDSHFLIEMVAEDLSIKKPEYVFVDVNQSKLGFTVFHTRQGKLKGEQIPFDYLNYFLRNEHFRTAWKPYRYMTSLDGSKSNWTDADYRFQVYKRQS